MMPRQKNEPRRSAWIPWVFIGAFAVIIAVNAVLVTFALSGFSGLVVERPFDRGRAYNDVLAEARRQQELGWSLSVSLQGEVLIAVLADRDGVPIHRAQIDAQVTRPVEPLPPIPVQFDHIGGGRYVGRVEWPKPGLWDVRLTAMGTRPQERIETLTRVVASTASNGTAGGSQ